MSMLCNNFLKWNNKYRIYSNRGISLIVHNGPYFWVNIYRRCSLKYYKAMLMCWFYIYFSVSLRESYALAMQDGEQLFSLFMPPPSWKICSKHWESHKSKLALLCWAVTWKGEIIKIVLLLDCVWKSISIFTNPTLFRTFVFSHD